MHLPLADVPGFDPVDGQHLCAGTAVYSQGWASLHGLRTVMRARGQGLARQLMACLAQEALALHRRHSPAPARGLCDCVALPLLARILRAMTGI